MQRLIGFLYKLFAFVALRIVLCRVGRCAVVLLTVTVCQSVRDITS